MNSLTVRERELVALGAALGANCLACVRHHVAEARAAEISPQHLAEAVELADAVRSVAAREALRAAHASLGAARDDEEAPAANSACAQLGRPSRHCC